MALTLGLAGVAYAQQQPATNAGAQAGTPGLEEVTVTGSRIRRTTDFDTANPTTVVDATYLKNLGIVNVGDAVSQLPANISNNTPTTTGNSSFFTGSTIANLRGLNPFFGSRTLTLINNRRFVPTNQGDGVDLNFIPSVLIERIDVVTGGASAAYGSGAVSGVNNIFLNRKLEGGRVDLDYYQTGESDGDDKHVGIAFGTSIADGRGHFVIGGEWQESDAVGCIGARDWCDRGVAFINGPPGGTQFLLSENVRANQMSYTGVFNNFAGGPTAQQLNAAGTGLVPFNIGQGQNTVPFNSVVGGDGRSVYEYTNLRTPVKRDVATAMFTFAVNDSTNLNVDLSYGNVESTNITGALDSNLQPVAADNAYLLASAELANAFPMGGALNKDWTSQLNSHSTTTTDVKRAAVGLDGTFGDSSWGWDAYYQYGKTNREQLVADNRHLNAYAMAVDAVVDPATNNIVCRVSLPGGFAAAVAANPRGGYALADPQIANGCVPLNSFGTQAIPQDAYNYAFGFLDENLDYKQQVAAFNVSGDLSEGIGAGPFQLAAGLEYRREVGHNIGSQAGAPDYVRTDYLIQYGESFSGKVGVTEGYLEFNAPLLKDRPGARRLELNLAARESEYKNTGLEGTTGESRTHDMFTWKASLIWDPVDWLRFRGTQSRDSRAANFRELYYGQKIHAGGTFGFCGPAGSFQQDPCDWSLEGNVNLKPEKADTTTLGLVFTPRDLLPGFQFAADYFRIKISDAIQQASVRWVLDGCQVSGIQSFCDLLVPDVPGSYAYVPGPAGGGSGIDNLRALSFNGSGYVYKGIDFTSSYGFDLNDVSNLNFRLIATRMIDQKFQSLPGGPFINVVGQTGTSNTFLSDNQPTSKWVANLSSTYNRGPLSLTGQVRFVSSGINNYNGRPPGTTVTTPLVTLDRNHVPSYSVWTLAGSYLFEDVGPMKTVQLFASVDNLFDKDPPIAVGTGFGGAAFGGTNAVFYDTLGRAYRLGIRTAF